MFNPHVEVVCPLVDPLMVCCHEVQQCPVGCRASHNNWGPLCAQFRVGETPAFLIVFDPPGLNGQIQNFNFL
jgi:hypothetical protein